MNRRIHMKLITHISSILVMLMNIPVFAQTSQGSLSGLLRDTTGAAIVGASVVAKNTSTGEEFRSKTGEQGAFVFPSIQPGRYSITIEAAGFKRTQVPDVTVEVGTPAKVDLTLEVGAVSEEVTVTGGVQEVINTTSPVLSNTINTRQVRDLPLLSRNPIDLARLQPGIAIVGTDTRGASVGGLRGSATNITQDGINAMDNFVKTDSFFARSAPSINATSEFSIAVGTVGADAGRGVAQVRIVTPSGSNDFHGNVFYQHRNDALNANTFFNNATGVEKEIERQHFFGFATSGPVYIPKVYDGRNRSFWFFSYEGFREPFSQTRNRTVLTPEARRGIFRYVGANGQPTSVNLLQLGNFGSLNPITGAQLNGMPDANNTLLGDGLNTAGFRYNVGGRDPNNKYSLRFDQQLFDSARLGSHKLEVVYHRGDFLISPDTFNNNEAPFPGSDVNGIQDSHRRLWATAIQSTFGAHVTNEARFGYQGGPVGFLREAPPQRPFFIDLQSVSDFDLRFMSQERETRVYQFADNFSVVKGAHTFRMGADIQSVSAITTNDAGIHPTIVTGTNSANPDGILTTEFPNLPAGAAGTAIANRARTIYRDLVGLIGSASRTFNVTDPESGFVEGATRSRLFKYRDVSLYFQDQWRAKRNLNLTFGLRWDFLGVPTLPDGLGLQVTNFEDLFGISGPGNLFNPGVTNGNAVATLDFISGDTGRGLYKNDWNNFAPSIGFAYSPSFQSGPLRWIFGSGSSSSIRAGYSISYLRDGFTVISNTLGVGTTNPGLIQTAANNVPTGVLTEAGVELTTPIFKSPITSAENFLINSQNGLWAVDPNLRTPYVQQWSLGIEREIAANTAIEVRYVGNHAIKVLRAADYNEVNIFENGFLQEFLNAQKNLAARGGSSFAPGAPGTVPLPILSTLFTGLAAAQGFTNTTFISNLQNNNIGTMASTLAFSPTYRTTRAGLAPNFFVTNPNAAFARVLGNFSFSNYNSLQVELRKRFSGGLQFQANYTFSKAIGDLTAIDSQSTLESFLSLRNLGLNRGLSDQDQRHRFIANFIYDLPFGRGRRYLSNVVSPVRKVVEGWTAGGIINWQTRPPFYITSNRATFNSFNAALNPAQLTGITFEEFKKNLGVFRHPAGVFFINPNLLDIQTDPSTGRLQSATLKEGLLGAPAPGTFGNFPINSLYGPRFFQADFSLVKKTYFSEQGNVEFRVTMLNAFNHPNFIYSGDNFDDATFGLINTQSGNQRIIHFAIGINW